MANNETIQSTQAHCRSTGCLHRTDPLPQDGPFCRVAGGPWSVDASSSDADIQTLYVALQRVKLTADARAASTESRPP